MIKINSSISSFEMEGIKRLTVKLLIFLPLLVFIGSVHYFDSYKSPTERGIAEILLSGRNVAIFPGHNPDYNDRLVHRFFIEGQHVPPDILVLGSSRAMEIGDNIFSNANIVNNSVIGAEFQDLLGVLSLYDKKGMLPKVIILGLDPWLLNPNLSNDQWVRLNGDVPGLLNNMRVSSFHFRLSLMLSSLNNLFSLSNFQASISNLFFKTPIESPYIATDAAVRDWTILLKDGRHFYSEGYVSTSVPEARALATNSSRLNDRYYKYSKPDPEIVNIFDKVISYLQTRNVGIVFYLSPFHPDTYAILLSSKNRVIVDIEKYYREVASKYNLRVIGSYDPSRCGLTTDDAFFDGMHIQGELVKKIFEQELRV